MGETFGRLLLWIVGVRTILWLLFYLVQRTVGIDDQSPTFLLAVIIYYVDVPARYVMGWCNISTSDLSVFIFGTIQWTMIALLLAGAYGVFRRKPVSREAAE